MFRDRGAIRGVTLGAVIACLASCAEQSPPREQGPVIVADPVQMRIIALPAAGHPASAPDEAVSPPVVSVVAVRPEGPPPPTSQPMATADEFITRQLAARPSRPDPLKEPLPRRPEIAPLGRPATPPGAEPAPAVPPAGTIRLGQPEVPADGTAPAAPAARLMLPSPDADVPMPATEAPDQQFDTPPGKTVAEADKAADSLPVVQKMSDAPLSGAAITVAGRAFTADEIIRPIWNELDRQAGLLAESRYRRKAAELIVGRMRTEIGEHLVLAEANRTMNDQATEAVDKTLSDLIRERIDQLGGGSEAKFRQQLKDKGTTLEQERDRTRRQLVVRSYLREKLLPQMHVTRPQAYEYYQRHIGEFSREAAVRLKLIHIKPSHWYPSGSMVTRQQRLDAGAQARKFAGELLARIRSGQATFDQAAARSDGPVDWGVVRKGSLRSAKLEEAVFALSAGQVSDVIEDEDGFYIAMAVSAEPRKYTSFAEAQPIIIPRMEQEKLDELSNAYMLRLYEQAGIEEKQVNDFVAECLKVVPIPRKRNSD